MPEDVKTIKVLLLDKDLKFLIDDIPDNIRSNKELMSELTFAQLQRLMLRFKRFESHIMEAGSNGGSGGGEETPDSSPKK